MGYIVPRRTAVVTFSGTDWDGAEVRCRMDVSLDILLWFQRQGKHENWGDSDVQEGVIKKFADDILLGWNLTEEDGSPIPCSSAGLSKQVPIGLTLVLFQKWLEECVTIPAPLVEPSPAGEPSAEP
jgi:hypothetical protein